MHEYCTERTITTKNTKKGQALLYILSRKTQQYNSIKHFHVATVQMIWLEQQRRNLCPMNVFLTMYNQLWVSNRPINFVLYNWGQDVMDSSRRLFYHVCQGALSHFSLILFRRKFESSTSRLLVWFYPFHRSFSKRKKLTSTSDFLKQKAG